MESAPEIDDVDGFVQGLTGCQDDLILFIRTSCGDFHLAADIRQEVNMVLWRKRRKFTAGTNFRSRAQRLCISETLSECVPMNPNSNDYRTAGSKEKPPRPKRLRRNACRSRIPRPAELLMPDGRTTSHDGEIAQLRVIIEIKNK